MSVTNFNPGIHPDAKAELQAFPSDEKSIIETVFASNWIITSAKEATIGNSRYRAILIKSNPEFKEMFNITREILVVFSPYFDFDSRSIDAIDYFSQEYNNLRLEEICSILISHDKNIKEAVANLLKKNEESKVVVPFSYVELRGALMREDHYIVENRFRECFYSRDLFGFQDPIRKDIYFFGRNDLIHKMVNRHISQENSGIFGLRKTGKTSILYGVERVLKEKRRASIFIDCETLHLKTWNKALWFIVKALRDKYGVKHNDIHNEGEYNNEGEVADYFIDDLTTIKRKISQKSILLIFDEIEHITFDTSVSQKWNSGEYFIKFWQVIRSAFQRTDKIFSYLIAGTNPRCVEKHSINNIDNPIYAQIPPEYIPGFSVEMTKEMLCKLGGYMGLEFDELVYSKLTEDYGGHPFLIRQVWSLLHKRINEKRPFKVTKLRYEEIKPTFALNDGNKYSVMILSVLEKFYKDEYYMLELLACGDIITFKGLAANSPEYTGHLINYGVIEEDNGNYGFKIDTLKDYLNNQGNYKKLNLSQAEKQQEISKRRNAVEPKLRKIVRNQLKGIFGETEAKKKVLAKYGKEAKKYAHLSYVDLFDSNKHEVYLNDLFELMRKNWEDGFRNLFEENVELFEARSKIINHFRKPDAHASDINDDDMNSFRGAMGWLEQKIDELT